MDARKNFAISTIATAPSPATSGTSLDVASGTGSRYPVAPFNAVVWPTGANPVAGNAEIIRVTSKGTGDNWTIIRAQESSSARTIIIGDQIMQSITNKTLQDIEDAVALNTAKTTNATHTGDVNGATTLTIGANTVTNAKAAQMATKTYKGRTSAGTGNAEDVAAVTLKTDLALVKGDVGLGSVDNTSDANKPVSTAQQTALNSKEDLSNKSTTTTLGASDALYPSQNAVKAYVDAAITAAKVAMQIAVGDVHISTVSTNPATSLGYGTWTAESEGYAIVGKASAGTFGTAGDTVGAQTHTLNGAEMPAHTHGFTDANYVVAANAGGNSRTQPASGTNAGFIDMRTTSSSGAGAAHNNIQPSKVFYIWRRTA